MKKSVVTTISLGILLLPALVFAQMEGTAPGATAHVSDIHTLIHNIENLAGLIFGAIAVISFVIAGILFLTSGGNPEKIAAARSAFLWGIAGVVVGIIAFSIIAIVSSFIGG